MFDAARHFEVFRKRALSNGGGLGLELKGDVKRMIIESRGGWSFTSLFVARSFHIYHIPIRFHSCQ